MRQQRLARALAVWRVCLGRFDGWLVFFSRFEDPVACSRGVVRRTQSGYDGHGARVMTILTFMIAYSAVAIFVVAVVLRFLMWSRMPMHLRWELYPVAHEGAKASYGGSYLEESEWWKRPRHFSLAGELGAMVPEILFLVALKEHNPKLWTRSFPFHFGLYLVAACTALMGVAGVLGAVLPGVMAGPVGGRGPRVDPGLGLCRPGARPDRRPRPDPASPPAAAARLLGPDGHRQPGVLRGRVRRRAGHSAGRGSQLRDRVAAGRATWSPSGWRRSPGRARR